MMDSTTGFTCAKTLISKLQYLIENNHRLWCQHENKLAIVTVAQMSTVKVHFWFYCCLHCGLFSRWTQCMSTDMTMCTHIPQGNNVAATNLRKTVAIKTVALNFPSASPKRQFNQLTLQVYASTPARTTHTQKANQKQSKSLVSPPGDRSLWKSEQWAVIFYSHLSIVTGTEPGSPLHIHFQLFLTTGEVPSVAKVSLFYS